MSTKQDVERVTLPQICSAAAAVQLDPWLLLLALARLLDELV
jgi:hypothetical protein